jgi:hypothetical protein
MASKGGQAVIPEEVLEEVAGAPFGIGRPGGVRSVSTHKIRDTV